MWSNDNATSSLLGLSYHVAMLQHCKLTMLQHGGAHKRCFFANRATNFKKMKNATVGQMYLHVYRWLSFGQVIDLE